jgi:hypothetical protein
MNTPMIFILCALYCWSSSLLGVDAANIAAFDHPGGIHPQQQLDFVKQKVIQKEQPFYNAYLQLLNKTAAAFTHPTHAVANFSVPGYYVNSSMHINRSFVLQADSFDAYACALGYHLSGGETVYAEQALRFVNAWADINKVYSDSDGPLVMTYAGTGLVIAGELLYNYKGWSPTEKAKFFQWVTNVHSKASNEIRTRNNNWGDWGRLGSILGAHVLDNTQQLQDTISLIKSDIFSKIAQDGHMPEEVVRESGGIWYTYFSLAPMTAACWVAYQTTKENLFTNYSQGNASIKLALDYLYYYNMHPDEWPWFKNPNKGSPSSWPGNLLEVMGSLYNDSRYIAYVQPARPIIYPTHHYAWTFPTLMKVQLNGYFDE